MATYNFIDRTNEVHGRLTVTGRSSAHKRTYWDCVCQCGNNTTVRGDHLKEGRVTSCGCYSEESHTKHGMARTAEYKCWQALKDRCNNPKNREYKNYGARGIMVCIEWNDSFMAFFADMGPRPDSDKSIDRIDNNGHYCASNCRWATNRQQVNNRRNSLIHEINGRSMCLKDWCREYKVPYTTAKYRISKGKSIEEALGI